MSNYLKKTLFSFLIFMMPYVNHSLEAMNNDPMDDDSKKRKISDGRSKGVSTHLTRELIETNDPENVEFVHQQALAGNEYVIQAMTHEEAEKKPEIANAKMKVCLSKEQKTNKKEAEALKEAALQFAEDD